MLPTWLSLVDVLFLVIVLMFTWGGFQKGFAAQLAHVLTFLFGGLLLFFAYPALYAYFGRIFRRLQEAYLMWMLLALLAVVCIGLFILFSKLLAKVIKAQISDGADAGWGIVFGLFRGVLAALLMMILLVMLDRSGTSYDRMRMKSYVGKAVCYEIVPRIQPRLTSLYENKIRDWQSELLKQDEAAGDIDI